MPRLSWTRRVGLVAAYGSGALGLVGAAAAGVLYGEVELARRSIRPIGVSPPACAGMYGIEYGGAPIVLVLLGDSSAAGYGVPTAAQTPGAVLASGLAGYAQRPVDLHCLAVVGARSPDLDGQAARAVAVRPDVAVILIGGNDVTHLTKAPVAVAHLAGAVRSLRAAGAEVVVGTCPDLGTIRPIQPPLRWLARFSSRSLAAAQTVAAVEAGGWTVSLGNLLGPEFARQPHLMFGADGFHPSAEGYRAAAEVILPTLVAAACLPSQPRPQLAGMPGVRSLAHAAVAAADRPGTEVSPASRHGRERGPAGRWARLRRHVRMRVARPTGPDIPERAVPLREDPPAPVEQT